MLRNLFIYLIGLLLALQGVKSVVTIDPNSCAPYPVTVRTSVDEMLEMIEAARIRTEDAYNLQAPELELRTVFNTFGAYFSTNNPPATARDLLCMFSPPSLTNVANQQVNRYPTDCWECTRYDSKRSNLLR
jgi:hypothetical protein